MRKKHHGVKRHLKAAVLLRDHYRCQYCGEFGSTVDHVIPRCKGGKNSPNNLVTACLKCNEIKANKPLGRFIRECKQSWSRISVYSAAGLMISLPIPPKLMTDHFAEVERTIRQRLSDSNVNNSFSRVRQV